MSARYMSKLSDEVTAIQLPHQTDWVIKYSKGPTYIVKDDEFQQAYTHLYNCQYSKRSYVWARTTTSSGSLINSGTLYARGDYIVSHDKDETHPYVMRKDAFLSQYRPA